ncbi:ribonuclease H-like domain-containing protein [Leadbettera azotonutricia]|uniref:YprB n=1 Tax=Leadbettera azotonutricia (strain ATCC BAA-888 / DSM 13862 / ZAS-9) TaxID=545695 RepID=F5YA77_LEAAZ|nr:ribonuclease H-like domain-containing protein [Leadbettera azotonutricia]AEF80334.1 YprB [Leadbettera azotonutricia ZAS-9]
MGQNLRARLGRIRAAQKNEEKIPSENSRRDSSGSRSPSGTEKAADPDSILPGWNQSGYKTLRRTVQSDLPFDAPEILLQALAILVPDFFRCSASKSMPVPGDLLFFDLETTGLSGGAGTVAFLAAFGRFRKQKLEITQYLLLDYPGEADFIEAVLKEFKIPGEAAGNSRREPVVVSYNGKSFDSQILKTRCLMNGVMAPDFFHADLLHPARRLWKTRLPDCSQATIETQILGLDRTGDISGAEAPEIWFNFLKTGETEALLDICEHNKKDICGLASILIALAEIAASPLGTREKFNFDFEALSLRWRETALKRTSFLNETEISAGKELLLKASEEGLPRAMFARALDLLREAEFKEGKRLLKRLISLKNIHPGTAEIKLLALRTLAMDAEWRVCDLQEALIHTEAALSLECLRESMKAEFIRRRERLLKKLGNPEVLNGN